VVAYEAFKGETKIPENKRRLGNYQIFFSRERGNYHVTFMGKRLATEADLVGGESELGRSVTYVIRSDFTLLGRAFAK
jgi:hypothetical protein